MLDVFEHVARDIFWNLHRNFLGKSHTKFHFALPLPALLTSADFLLVLYSGKWSSTNARETQKKLYMPKSNGVFVLHLLRTSGRFVRCAVLLIYSLFCTQTTSIPAIMGIAVSDQPTDSGYRLSTHTERNVNTKYQRKWNGREHMYMLRNHPFKAYGLEIQMLSFCGNANACCFCYIFSDSQLAFSDVDCFSTFDFNHFLCFNIMLSRMICRKCLKITT